LDCGAAAPLCCATEQLKQPSRDKFDQPKSARALAQSKTLARDPTFFTATPHFEIERQLPGRQPLSITRS